MLSTSATRRLTRSLLAFYGQEFYISEIHASQVSSLARQISILIIEAAHARGQVVVILSTVSLFLYVLSGKNVIPISSSLHPRASWRRLRQRDKHTHIKHQFHLHFKEEGIVCFHWLSNVSREPNKMTKFWTDEPTGSNNSKELL